MRHLLRQSVSQIDRLNEIRELFNLVIQENDLNSENAIRLYATIQEATQNELKLATSIKDAMLAKEEKTD